MSGCKHFVILIVLIFSWGLSIADMEETNRRYDQSYRDTVGTFLEVNFLDTVNDKIYTENLEVSLRGNGQSKAKTYTCKKGRFLKKIDPPDTAVVQYTFHSLISGDVLLTLSKNKINVVTLFLERPLLQFRYKEDALTPVKYNVSVKNNTSNEGNGVFYPCQESKWYAPGKYLVEVDSKPPSRFSIIFQYNEIYEIQLYKTGKLMITKGEGVSDILLYYPVENDWRELELKKGTLLDSLELLPWPFMITWVKNGEQKKGEVKVISEAAIQFRCD